MFTIDWLFYQQYHFANSCSQGKKMVVFANDRIVFLAGRAQGVRVDSGSILLFLYSIIRSQRTKANKGVFSVLLCFASDYYFAYLQRQMNPMIQPCEKGRMLSLPSRFVYLWREQGAKGDFCPGERSSSRSLALYFWPQFLSVWRGYCNLVYNCSSCMWD